jgi:flagellar biogenesis protein FliO
MNLFSLLLIFAENPPVEAPALPDIGTVFLRMLFWLLIIVALLLGSYFFLKRTFKGRLPHSRTKSIEVIEKILVSPKTALYLIRVKGKAVLFAESQLEIKALDSFILDERVAQTQDDEVEE